MRMFDIKRILPALCLGSLVWLSSAGPGRADHVHFYVDALPPYAVLHDNGPPTGFAVALMGALMNTVGEHFSPSDVEVMTWARSVNHVEVVPKTALLVLTKLPERVDRYKWVGPLDELPIGVIAPKDSGVVIDRPEDLLNYRVGIVRNTAPYRVLLHDLPEIAPNLVMFSGIPALLRMLRERRVDAIVQAVRAAKQLMPAEGMNPDDYTAVFMLGSLPIYFGFNKSTDDSLIHRLQSALDKFKEVDALGSSPYERMREKYFGRELPNVAGAGAE